MTKFTADGWWGEDHHGQVTLAKKDARGWILSTEGGDESFTCEGFKIIAWADPVIRHPTTAVTEFGLLSTLKWGKYFDDACELTWLCAIELEDGTVQTGGLNYQGERYWSILHVEQMVKDEGRRLLVALFVACEDDALRLADAETDKADLDAKFPRTLSAPKLGSNAEYAAWESRFIEQWKYKEPEPKPAQTLAPWAAGTPTSAPWA